SFLGKVPLASFRAAYSAAKAALNSLTHNLRMDIRTTHPDVQVTLVLPGNVLHKGPLRPRPAISAPPQTAEDVARAIVGAIEVPVAEVYTNALQHDTAMRFIAEPF